MSIVTKTFGVSCAVLPVIHIQTRSQCYDEALAALECGANGVFVIDHGGDYSLTAEIAEEVWHYLRSEGHEMPFVGVNLLGIERPADAYRYLHERRAYDVGGVWCDSATRFSKAFTALGVLRFFKYTYSDIMNALII
jgi:hypothetical protein